MFFYPCLLLLLFFIICLSHVILMHFSHFLLFPSLSNCVNIFIGRDTCMKVKVFEKMRVRVVHTCVCEFKDISHLTYESCK